MADLRVGTSGYSYQEWKGSFYPEKIKPKEMLSFYARHFSTVEINHTFYRMPAESLLDGWIESVPAGFQFALKLNQKITHTLKLRNCADILKRFLEVASLLTQPNALAPILVQLPPFFRADLAVLEEFLRLRPPAYRFALEVRHASWHTEDTYTLLRQHQVALCLAETDEQTPPELLTAGFAYVRLRRESYTPKQLASWKERFDSWVREGNDVYIYLKHAEKAPAYARQLLSC